MQDIINSPSLSQRCQEIHQERQEKIKVKQKLSSLLERNRNLLKNLSSKRKSMRLKLESNQRKIKNELYLTNLQIESKEENIIRSGCPGINLNN